MMVNAIFSVSPQAIYDIDGPADAVRIKQYLEFLWISKCTTGRCVIERDVVQVFNDVRGTQINVIFRRAANASDLPSGSIALTRCFFLRNSLSDTPLHIYYPCLLGTRQAIKAAISEILSSPNSLRSMAWRAQINQPWLSVLQSIPGAMMVNCLPASSLGRLPPTVAPSFGQLTFDSFYLCNVHFRFRKFGFS